jgi:hypothetical protein
MHKIQKDLSPIRYIYQKSKNQISGQKNNNRKAFSLRMIMDKQSD